MDETLQELENELKRLRPQRISPEVLAHLSRELGSPRGSRRFTTATSLSTWKWAAWALGGVAVLIAAALMLRRPAVVGALPAVPGTTIAVAPSAKPVNRYEPVRASSVLYDLKDDGLTAVPDGSSARQVRYRYVDTYTWKNPATNASLRWSVPREEVRLVRANLD